MKHHFRSLFLLALLVLATPVSAQVQSSGSEKVYTLRSGSAVMTVDAQRGAKITSLTLDGKELLAQHRKIEGMRFENMNDYGSTFWPSPQSEWNWPPIATYDSNPYSAVAEDSRLTLTSGKDTKYPYIFEKTFQTLGDGGFSITYRIINDGETAVSVAPWEITRVPSGGRIFFEAPALRPENEVDFQQEQGVICIPFVPKERQNRKVFADARGWLAFADNGLLFVKLFDDIAHEQAAPGEEEVEIYYNFGTTYTEIENQGAYQNLAPHSSCTWTVRWHLSALDAQADVSAVLSSVRQIQSR